MTEIPKRSRYDEAVELVASFMTRNGFATGHGDTIEDLLTEFQWQLNERTERLLLAEVGLQNAVQKWRLIK
jgi:hypothetical protein